MQAPHRHTVYLTLDMTFGISAMANHTLPAAGRAPSSLLSEKFVG